MFQQFARRASLLLLLLAISACRNSNAEPSPAKLTPTPQHLLAGGYPEAEDFERLKAAGVTTVVCLLDPRLPEEAQLIATEEKLARINGMRMINLPMSSELSKKTSKTYRSKVEEAVKKIGNEEGTVYFHCYHGVHRTGSVEALLREKGFAVEDFVVEKRKDEAQAIEHAEEQYANGDYAAAIKTLQQLPQLDHRAHALLGWAQFKSGDLGNARNTFEKILNRVPESIEARNGLGYVKLRTGDLTGADTAFKAVLDAEPEESDAHLGLAFVRMRQSNFASAERHAKACLESSPDNKEAKDLLRSVQKKLTKK